MNFNINGVDLLTEPTDHYWIAKTVLGFDGNGHPVYVMPRSYELDFDWIDSNSFAQLIGFYNSTTGTSQIKLPTWNSATGGFSSYSCTLEEPSYTHSFEGFYGGVKLLVLNIH
jgi:hypothetical protein